MPEGLVKKHEEKMWEEARAEVENRQKKKLKKKKLADKDIPWALVNHIFQMKKRQKTAAVCSGFEKIAQAIIDSRGRSGLLTERVAKNILDAIVVDRTCEK